MQGQSYTCSLRSRINSTRVHPHIRLKLSDSPDYAGSHRRLGMPYWQSSSLITCLSLAVDSYLYGKSRQGMHCLTVGSPTFVLPPHSGKRELVLLARVS